MSDVEIKSEVEEKLAHDLIALAASHEEAMRRANRAERRVVILLDQIELLTKDKKNG